MALENWSSAIDALIKGGMDRNQAAQAAKQQLAQLGAEKMAMVDRLQNTRGFDYGLGKNIGSTVNNSLVGQQRGLNQTINDMLTPKFDMQSYANSFVRQPQAPKTQQEANALGTLQQMAGAPAANPGSFQSAYDFLSPYTAKPAMGGGFQAQQPQQQMQPQQQQPQQQQPQQQMQAPLGGMGQQQDAGFAQRPADMFNFGPMYGGGGYGMNPYAGMFGPQQSNMGYGMMGGYGMNPRQMMMGGYGQQQQMQPQQQMPQQQQPQQQRGGGLPQGFRDWAMKNNIGRPQNAQAFQNIYNQYQQQQQQTPMF